MLAVTPWGPPLFSCFGVKMFVAPYLARSPRHRLPVVPAAVGDDARKLLWEGFEIEFSIKL